MEDEYEQILAEMTAAFRLRYVCNIDQLLFEKNVAADISLQGESVGPLP